jgi:hypothetical protein
MLLDGSSSVRVIHATRGVGNNNEWKVKENSWFQLGAGYSARRLRFR